jgi:curved DNA-binding protein CbpA
VKLEDDRSEITMADASGYERIWAWDEVLDDSTYYEILGILEIADDAEIKRAFHEFAQSFHPDAHLDADEETLAAVRRVYQRGAEAYRVLTNAELRSKYDLSVAKGIVRLDAGEVPKRVAVGVGARSLDELCKTPAARLNAQKADALISQGDLAGARRELLLAYEHDDRKNPELRERLEALDLALFAMGS